MAVLATQGHKKLGLTNASDNKQLVFVKLTDSFYEALSNYIQNQTKLQSKSQYHQRNGCKPTIQFTNNAVGKFTVPLPDEEGNGSGKFQTFSFSLKPMAENGPQGSFECLQTNLTTRPGSLESLGPIQDKVQVQASDDAYTRFGEKMSNVKKDNDRRTARLQIDRNSASNGLVTTNKFVSSRNKIIASAASANHHRQQQSNPESLHRYNHSSHGSTNQNPHNRPPPPHHGLLSGSHPMLDRSKHKKQNPEIMKRTLRERVVHLLAVRPLKKPELLDRMARDGLREKEKKELFPIVKQVSVMKDNTYILQRHIWNDVSEDWPFYSEEERQAFRRRKPQNLTPPGSDGSTGSAASGHSSSSSHPASPQPPSGLKRSASSASFLCSDSIESEHASMSLNGPSAKKKRVSNYLRQPGLSPNQGLSPLNMGRSPSKSPQVNNSGDTFMMTMATESGESKTNAWLKTNLSDNVNPATANQSNAAGFSNSSTMIPSATSANSTGNRTNISQDFKTKFVKIGSSEQRRVYKAEFNKDYNRYMVLHGQLQRVSQRFAKMQRKLKQTPETSPEYQRLKKMIMDEYQTQQSSGFKRDQDEFQYLHQKLAHIKKLVHDFDTSGGSNKKLSKSTNHQSSSSRQNNHQILQASS